MKQDIYDALNWVLDLLMTGGKIIAGIAVVLVIGTIAVKAIPALKWVLIIAAVILGLGALSDPLGFLDNAQTEIGGP